MLRRLLKKLARTFSDELPDRLPGVPETEDWKVIIIKTNYYAYFSRDF